MQNQRNAGSRNARSGNRHFNDNFEGNNGNANRYPGRYSQERGSRDMNQGYDRYAEDDWQNTGNNRNYGDRYNGQRFENSRNDDWQANSRDGLYSGRGYEDDYEDVTGYYGTSENNVSRNYGSPYNQQGDRRYGSNGRGYNELSGGRNDQYDRDRSDDWNRNDWGRNDRYDQDRNSNNGYNSFDRYADRGNYNTARNGGGGYGSTTNRYEDGISSRNNQSDRYGSDNYGSFNNGNSDWQNGQRQRISRRGFGSMSPEKRRSLAKGGRTLHEAR